MLTSAHCGILVVSNLYRLINTEWNNALLQVPPPRTDRINLAELVWI